ncbi:MAG: DUF4976 domain-containing protein, partial [Planctomycetaceae bacterium]|nr:DUF4976 domain-containing protein [Planctomycetaceae bacterium]
LMVRWPEQIKPGSVSDALVSNVDFAETFLDLAGLDIPADMQGYSLVPLLKGETPADWRKAHYYQYYEFLNDRKTPHMVRRHYGVRTDRYKLIHYYNVDEWELYDLEADPREMRNIYAEPQYADIIKQLKQQITDLQGELEVPDDRGSVEADPPCLNPQPKPGRRQKQGAEK